MTQPEQPVNIDIERMERALAGPRYMVLNGLTVEQVGEFFDTISRVANDATEAERERCAKLAESFATCGCNGARGYCNADSQPLAIAAAIREGKQ